MHGLICVALLGVNKLPFLTYFTATDEIYIGWKAFNEESGPTMHWYGWLLKSFFVNGFSWWLLNLCSPPIDKEISFSF